MTKMYNLRSSSFRAALMIAAGAASSPRPSMDVCGSVGFRSHPVVGITALKLNMQPKPLRLPPMHLRKIFDKSLLELVGGDRLSFKLSVQRDVRINEINQLEYLDSGKGDVEHIKVSLSYNNVEINRIEKRDNFESVVVFQNVDWRDTGLVTYIEFSSAAVKNAWSNSRTDKVLDVQLDESKNFIIGSFDQELVGESFLVPKTINVLPMKYIHGAVVNPSRRGVSSSLEGATEREHFIRERKNYEDLGATLEYYTGRGH